MFGQLEFGSVNEVYREQISQGRAVVLASLKEVRAAVHNTVFFFDILIDPGAIENPDNPTASPVVSSFGGPRNYHWHQLLADAQNFPGVALHTAEPVQLGT